MAMAKSKTVNSYTIVSRSVTIISNSENNIIHVQTMKMTIRIQQQNNKTTTTTTTTIIF